MNKGKKDKKFEWNMPCENYLSNFEINIMGYIQTSIVIYLLHIQVRGFAIGIRTRL